MKKTKLVLIFLGLSLVACASLKHQAPVVVKPPWQRDFELAQVQYDHSEYQQAYDSFRVYGERYASTPYTFSALFFAGRSLEAMKRFEDALVYYRRVVELTKEDNPEQRKLRAQALHRQSFCYEELGQDDQLIATLLDLQRFASDHTQLTMTVEVPARLAAAYSRLGNIPLAETYFKSAETAFNKQTQLESSRPWLAETLQAMGRAAFTSVTPQNLSDRMQAVIQGQRYLIRAVELNALPFSQQAYDLLTSTYANWTQFLHEAQDQESTLSPFALRASRAERLQISKAFAAALVEAKLSMLPVPTSSTNGWEALLKAEVEKYEKIITGLLYRGAPSTPLTPEALSREGQVKGRMVDPESDRKSGVKK